MSLLASMVGQAESSGGDQMQVDQPCHGSAPDASAPFSAQEPVTTRSAARAARDAAAHAAATSAEAASSSLAGMHMMGPAGEAGPSGSAGAVGRSSTEDAGEAGSSRSARDPAQAPLRKLSVSLIDTYKTINQVRRRACTAGVQSAGEGLLASVPAAARRSVREAAPGHALQSG